MTAPAFYSEHDPHAAAWLRELIRADLIPPGVVDERDVRKLLAADLAGFGSVHLFAGIGGWPYALRLAGWPDARPVWTGSCPCQPYSAAGRGLGDADPRNLWPVMFELARECRPDTVFGEQVENAIRHGWFDRVSTDMEGEGYAVGAAVLGAHSTGAPHIRQRLYWMADAVRIRRHPRRGPGGRLEASEREEPRDQPQRDRIPRGRVGNPGRAGQPTPEREAVPGPRRREEGGTTAQPGSPPDPGFWGDYSLIDCRDGRTRRAEPGVFPLAHGVPGRVGKLRGYGNAIVPQVAAEFVRAFLDIEAGQGEG